MVASVDGATAIDGVSGGLGGPADKQVFSAIRGVADVILAGAGTVRAERYGPPRTPPSIQAARRARGQAAKPRLAVVSRSLDLDPGHGPVHRRPPTDRSSSRPAPPTPIAGPPWPRWPTSSRRGPPTSTSPSRSPTLRDAGVGVVVGEGGPVAQRPAGGRRTGRRAVRDALPSSRRRRLVAPRGRPGRGADRSAARPPARGGRRSSSCATSGPERALGPAPAAAAVAAVSGGRASARSPW